LALESPRGLKAAARYTKTDGAPAHPPIIAPGVCTTARAEARTGAHRQAYTGTRV